jgi:hypothetical protein
MPTSNSPTSSPTSPSRTSKPTSSPIVIHDGEAWSELSTVVHGGFRLGSFSFCTNDFALSPNGCGVNEVESSSPPSSFRLLFCFQAALEDMQTQNRAVSV